MSNIIIEARLKRKTDKALLVDIDGKNHWLPISKLSALSQAQRDEHTCKHHVDWQSWENGDNEADTMLSIPEWLATKNGLI